MRKIKKMLMMSLVGIFTVAFISSLSFAGEPIKPKAGPDVKELRKPVSVPLPDLIVTNIYGANCPNCTCGRTNFGSHPLVEYQEDIKVHVSNQGRAASDPCTLKIEFYDIIGGRTVVINKSVPRIEPARSTVVIENGEFLYRKSSGIKATVDSTNVVTESSEGNNTKTVTECAIEPLI